MEDIRTQYIEDDNRESLIKHWETRLSDSLQAVYVAQHQLEALYKSRYEEVSRPLGHTALSEQLSERVLPAA